VYVTSSPRVTGRATRRVRDLAAAIGQTIHILRKAIDQY
jgi:hypothetical protein